MICCLTDVRPEKIMKKYLFLSLSILLSFVMPSTGWTFVPEATHLMHLVQNKIKEPAGIEVWQNKVILDYQDSDQPYVKIKENLIFSFPGRLRINTFPDILANFSVESDFNFFKISEREGISREKSLTDLYTDILLYRDNENYLKQLDLWGTDTEEVSFQRYNDTICYVIGKPRKKNSEVPGLWIEKNTFLPLRYVVEKNSQQVEFVYKNWKQVSKTFYPMQIHIFLNSRLFAMINVEHINLHSNAPSGLFNIDNLLKTYPADDTVDNHKIKDRSITGEYENSLPETRQLHE